MSRSTITIIIGGALGLAVGILIAGVLLFGGRLFNSRTEFEPTPAIVQLETPAGPTVTVAPTETATATPTVTADGSVTVVATTAVPTTTSNNPQPAPATPIVVSNTAVQYVQAQVDVNIRSGPGTGYLVIGWIAGGQTAKVTGVNEATGWWRVICPDDTVGSCWVTGGRQFTVPTNGPVVATPTVAPTVMPTPSVCTDKASLVADITVPDNTEYAPNIGFNKTWRIKNTGTCTWSGNYHIAHVGGSLMGAITTVFPLNQSVAPGQTADISISMVSPAAAGTYRSDWKLVNVAGKQFGLGANNNPFYVQIVVTDPNIPSTISGVVFQDWNENGVYDAGDTPMGNREVVLISGTACHVSQAPVAVVRSGADGVYTFKGNYNGSYCVGLNTADGLEDVRGVTVAPGQVITNLHLRAFAPLGSISGYLWNDYCALVGSSNTWVGNCVSDGTGSYRADGMIQPTEVNIPGVTVLLRAGSCSNNNAVAVSAVTDGNGRYTFGSLSAGTYCVSIDATSAANASLLLPGWFTFPQVNVWYQEITLTQGANAYSVNFGWDYQFN